MKALLGIALLVGTIAFLRRLAPGPDRQPHPFLQRFGMDTALAVLLTTSFTVGIALTIHGAFELWQDSAALWVAFK
jgi:hypothetical protein